MMNNLLLKTIEQSIKAAPEHRITFAQFMDLVLYHPELGYYNSGVKIGAKGDYFTSVALGKDFGELVAEQLIEIWHHLQRPKPFTIMEMGAGEGSLAADIINYLYQQKAEFLDSVEYVIVERANKLIEQQQKSLQFLSDRGTNISWKTWEKIEPNSIIGCCISNELVDAFPVHLLTINSGKLQEIYVTIKDNNLRETIGDLSTTQISSYFDSIELDFSSSAYPEGYRTEVNLAALDWLKTVSHRLAKGYLITVDYGYTGDRYYSPQRSQGTLQCYYQHRRHYNPYVNLGEQDITAHVDFTALQQFGEQLGLHTVGFTRQGLFLMALGLGDRLNDLSSGKYSLQEILQRRDALHQLIDPAGLGNFGVLIQSKGVEAPLKGLTTPY